MKGPVYPYRNLRPSSRHRVGVAVFQFIFVMVLMGLLIGSQGCYHYYVVADEAKEEGSTYSEKTVDTYVWGLISNVATTQGLCPEGQGLYDVRVTRNLGHMVASSLTLGLWAPLKVQWRCAKRPAATTPDSL